ncbi:MAG: hypothetical protein ABJD68_17415 [Nakamurella sp.]
MSARLFYTCESGSEGSIPLHDRDRSLLLAGCMFQASTTVVGDLFDDLEYLGDSRSDDIRGAIQSTVVLSGLPDRFAHRYNLGFARKFLVATVDLTARLTHGWEPASCVAQELGLRLVLDRMADNIDMWGMIVDRRGRTHLEEALFEDLDHELLYDPSMDGFENEPDTVQGMTPMDFDSWFVPFNSKRHLPPYASDL